jgi:hypothetical protein
MAPHEIAALVNKLNPRLLEGLAPDDLTCVLDVGTIRRFRRHALLAREGYSADNLFLLLEGLGRTFTTTQKGRKWCFCGFRLENFPVEGRSSLNLQSI